MVPASSKEFLEIQATIECGFNLKDVRDMISYSLIHTIKLFSYFGLFYKINTALVGIIVQLPQKINLIVPA